MGKSFDKIDIVFIVLISVYLLALVIGILWIILDKLEKAKMKITNQVKAVKQEVKVKTEEPKLADITSITKPKSAEAKKKKTTNNKNKSITIKKKTTEASKTTAKNNVKSKSKNNSSNRSNGYVSPTKRKKNNRKKKGASKNKKSTKR